MLVIEFAYFYVHFCNAWKRRVRNKDRRGHKKSENVHMNSVTKIKASYEIQRSPFLKSSKSLKEYTTSGSLS